MAQKQLAPHRIATTIRLDHELYDALMSAGRLRGLTTTNEILETAAFEFIEAAARDAGLVEELERRQAELKKVLEARKVAA